MSWRLIRVDTAVKSGAREKQPLGVGDALRLEAPLALGAGAAVATAALLRNYAVLNKPSPGRVRQQHSVKLQPPSALLINPLLNSASLLAKQAIKLRIVF